MKVIYCGYRGTYGAYLIAALHTGLYKEDSLPNSYQIKKHFKICCLYGEQYGNLIYVGIDEKLREIYVLGCKGYFTVIRNVHTHINEIFKTNEKLHHIDVTTTEGIIPRIIGFLIAHGVNRGFCEKLFSYWIYSKYKKFVRLMRRQKLEDKK